MEETKKQLQQTISEHYPINAGCPQHHTKLYAIHTILYAIVAMRLRFFKNDDIRKLFAPLKNIGNEELNEKLNEKLNFIFTLLDTYKDLNVESAAECVAESFKPAGKLFKPAGKLFKPAASFSESATESASDSVADSEKRFNESATESAKKCVADSDKYSIDVADSQYDIYIGYITDAQTNADFAYLSYSAANSANKTKSAKLALLHLIYAYLIIVKQK